ncbi:hypothetical protein ACNPQM_35900 [Streptomyces sp. NPDC056231]|uniref:hypothetical protein n=1 Tax=Streptomyces sp. NPDC056231 TaxID=3345755 RepID=UPI003AAE62AD
MAAANTPEESRLTLRARVEHWTEKLDPWVALLQKVLIIGELCRVIMKITTELL